MKLFIRFVISVLIHIILCVFLYWGEYYYTFSHIMYWIISSLNLIVLFSSNDPDIKYTIKTRGWFTSFVNSILWLLGVFLLIKNGSIACAVFASVIELIDSSIYLNLRFGIGKSKK